MKTNSRRSLLLTTSLRGATPEILPPGAAPETPPSGAAPGIPPDMLLPRDATAEALTALGYPITIATLATMACRGGGPVYQLFGRKPPYRWGESIAWAEGRLSAPRRSMSEADAQQNVAA